jgi:hypothetical protein
MKYCCFIVCVICVSVLLPSAMSQQAQQPDIVSEAGDTFVDTLRLDFDLDACPGPDTFPDTIPDADQRASGVVSFSSEDPTNAACQQYGGDNSEEHVMGEVNLLDEPLWGLFPTPCPIAGRLSLFTHLVTQSSASAHSSSMPSSAPSCSNANATLSLRCGASESGDEIVEPGARRHWEWPIRGHARTVMNELYTIELLLKIAPILGETIFRSCIFALLENRANYLTKLRPGGSLRSWDVILQQELDCRRGTAAEWQSYGETESCDEAELIHEEVTELETLRTDDPDHFSEGLSNRLRRKTNWLRNWRHRKHEDFNAMQLEYREKCLQDEEQVLRSRGIQVWQRGPDRDAEEAEIMKWNVERRAKRTLNASGCLCSVCL